jgi:hypothetical protein
MNNNISGTTATTANGFTQAEIAYLGGTGSIVPATWNILFPPGDLRRYGATCSGAIICTNVLSQSFPTITDDAALTTASTMYSNYGQDIIFPSGCVISLSSQHTITAPPNSFGKIIGYGSIVITNQASPIFQLKKTASNGWTSPGITVQGLTVFQMNTTTATGAFLVSGASNTTFQDCMFIAANVAANYSAITFNESAPSATAGDTVGANSAPFWCRVNNCQFISASESPVMPTAITTYGECNNLVVNNSSFNQFNTAISLQPPTLGNNSIDNIANAVVISNCAFENGTYAVLCGPVGGTTKWNTAGLTFTNNRIENVTNGLYLGVTISDGCPIYYTNNTIISGGILTNVYNTPIVGNIGPSQSGTGTVAAGTAATGYTTITLPIPMPNKNYKVSLTPTSNPGGVQLFVLQSSKTTAGFNVSPSSTVPLSLRAGITFDWYIHYP